MPSVIHEALQGVQVYPREVLRAGIDLCNHLSCKTVRNLSLLLLLRSSCHSPCPERFCKMVKMMHNPSVRQIALWIELLMNREDNKEHYRGLISNRCYQSAAPTSLVVQGQLFMGPSSRRSGRKEIGPELAC